MNDEKMHWFMIGGILLLLVLAFTQMGSKKIVVQNSNDMNKISVTGSAGKEVVPDKAVLTLSVMSEGKEAKAVQDQNSLKMNDVMKALKDAGLDTKDIETTQYTLYPGDEWDQTSQKNVRKGYRAENMIQVTIKDISRAGEILDVAVKSGVNTVNNVAFMLSEAKEKEVKDALVKEASVQARAKAQNLAKGLGVSVGKVLFVTETSYNPGPWYYNTFNKAAVMESAAPTPLSPASVKISLQVNVDFEIE